MRLTPSPVVTEADLTLGKRALVQDSAWASLAGSLYGGVILVGFALELGASPSARWGQVLPFAAKGKT